MAGTKADGSGNDAAAAAAANRDAALRGRIEQHLSTVAGGPRPPCVQKVALLAGGACQENFVVELAGPDGAAPVRMVLRSDAKSSLPESIDRAGEYQVIVAACAAGVKTPHARWFGKGIVRDGAGAYFLDWVTGEAIGRRVVQSPELAGARAKLPAELAQELAKIHSITPKTHPALFGDARKRVQEASFDPVADALATVRAMVDDLGSPRPALELAMRWLSENRATGRGPLSRAVTLVHGDFRTGNFMVTPDGLAAILDWEFAHFSSPAWDLAWVSVRDWRFNALALPVGGFAKRAPFFEAYAKASGREVDPREVHWWEVLGNVRWATGSIAQGKRFASGAESDIELAAIGRRAVEMEFEALRLIDAGARA
jgi:aminoglycoside phosphotransferase (APT) family kinase protein